MTLYLLLMKLAGSPDLRASVERSAERTEFCVALFLDFYSNIIQMRHDFLSDMLSLVYFASVKYPFKLGLESVF